MVTSRVTRDILQVSHAFVSINLFSSSSRSRPPAAFSRVLLFIFVCLTSYSSSNISHNLHHPPAPILAGKMREGNWSKNLKMSSSQPLMVSGQCDKNISSPSSQRIPKKDTPCDRVEPFTPQPSPNLHHDKPQSDQTPHLTRVRSKKTHGICDVEHELETINGKVESPGSFHVPKAGSKHAVIKVKSIEDSYSFQDVEQDVTWSPNKLRRKKRRMMPCACACCRPGGCACSPTFAGVIGAILIGAMCIGLLSIKSAAGHYDLNQIHVPDINKFTAENPEYNFIAVKHIRSYARFVLMNRTGLDKSYISATYQLGHFTDGKVNIPGITKLLTNQLDKESYFSWYEDKNRFWSCLNNHRGTYDYKVLPERTTFDLSVENEGLKSVLTNFTNYFGFGQVSLPVDWGNYVEEQRFREPDGQTKAFLMLETHPNFMPQ